MSESARDVLETALKAASLAGSHRFGDLTRPEKRVDDLIGALAAAGYAVVPAEPTEEMLAAGEGVETTCGEQVLRTGYLAEAFWLAMLAAANKP